MKFSLLTSCILASIATSVTEAEYSNHLARLAPPHLRHLSPLSNNSSRDGVEITLNTTEIESNGGLLVTLTHDKASGEQPGDWLAIYDDGVNISEVSPIRFVNLTKQFSDYGMMNTSGPINRLITFRPTAMRSDQKVVLISGRPMFPLYCSLGNWIRSPKQIQLNCDGGLQMNESNYEAYGERKYCSW